MWLGTFARSRFRLGFGEEKARGKSDMKIYFNQTDEFVSRLTESSRVSFPNVSSENLSLCCYCYCCYTVANISVVQNPIR